MSSTLGSFVSEYAETIFFHRTSFDSWPVDIQQAMQTAVTEAVDLGGDTDTIGAVTGQLAGAVFGTASIPRRWIDGLHGAARLADLARELHAWAPDSTMSNL